jgi:hypothetical protein
MEIWGWLAHNWFVCLQSVGIIGGLLFTGASLRIDAKARRISNLISITEHHRNLLAQVYSQPNLLRTLDETPNLHQKPVTEEERLFVILLIAHLNSAYHATKDGMLLKAGALSKDIRSFFSRPIPKAIWSDVKSFQDKDFVRFVEDCLGSR